MPNTVAVVGPLLLFTVKLINCCLHLLSPLPLLPITPQSTGIWILREWLYKRNLAEVTVDLRVTFQDLFDILEAETFVGLSLFN